MINYDYYESPLGQLILTSEMDKLTGVRYKTEKFDCNKLASLGEQNCTCDALIKAKAWLNSYFNGENPKISEIDIAPFGNIFRLTVWKLLCDIPYGRTTTYGEIATKTAMILGKARMSAQAVGGAIGSNPLAIIIPCHRVIAKDGNVTGYAGGIDKKLYLLNLEGVDVAKIITSKK